MVIVCVCVCVGGGGGLVWDSLSMHAMEESLGTLDHFACPLRKILKIAVVMSTTTI